MYTAGWWFSWGPLHFFHYFYIALLLWEYISWILITSLIFHLMITFLFTLTRHTLRRRHFTPPRCRSQLATKAYASQLYGRSSRPAPAGNALTTLIRLLSYYLLAIIMRWWRFSGAPGRRPRGDYVLPPRVYACALNSLRKTKALSVIGQPGCHYFAITTSPVESIFMLILFSLNIDIAGAGATAKSLKPHSHYLISSRHIDVFILIGLAAILSSNNTIYIDYNDFAYSTTSQYLLALSNYFWVSTSASNYFLFSYWWASHAMPCYRRSRWNAPPSRIRYIALSNISAWLYWLYIVIESSRRAFLHTAFGISFLHSLQ